MKIKIGDVDAHHRVSGGASMKYSAGKEYDNVPKAIADALVKKNQAEIITPKPSGKDT